MIFIQHPFGCGLKYFDFETFPVDGSVIRNEIGNYFGYTDFGLLCNGRKLHDAEVVPDNSTIHVTFSLPGGKGGFGSMLRAIGAQIEKTTNREACRDLSGRRLRDINEEQRLKKWIAKKAEREAEKKRRREARIERLKSKPAHKFFNYEYEKEISELPDRVNDALSEGLQKAKEPVKRACEKAGPSEPRKKKIWLSDELSTSSSDSETNVAEDGSPSKKPKTDFKDSSSYDSSSEISDLSQPGPSSSKENSNILSEEISSSNSECTYSGGQNADVQSNDSTSNLVNVDIQCPGSTNVCNTEESDLSTKELNNVNENKTECFTDGESQSNKDVVLVKESEKANTVSNDPEIQDNCPINLLDYQSSAEMEALGLDKLKMELMSRGVKCGGTLSDRAQRLWTIRGLQPNEYPSKLLAKKK